MSQQDRGKGSRRALILVIDGCGVGAAPDADRFGDRSDCNSLGNTAGRVGGLQLPNLARLGLGNIDSFAGVEPVADPSGFYGKLQESSLGKDTQTGHWEMMGLVNQTVFPLYPNGFPPEIIQQFIDETGCKGVLANKPASGTEILVDLGKEHQKTGYPIVYTSGDSVFQIACHTQTTPLATLYRWCEIARQILQGLHRVGRVIARPFAGSPGEYYRLNAQRRDYAVPPHGPTLLDACVAEGLGVLGIGKIEDIFAKQGLTHARHTANNEDGLNVTLAAMLGELDLKPLAIVDNAPQTAQVIFTNLVDTDMVYGHRRNAEGYAEALVAIDKWLPQLISSLSNEDLLVISSDHGNDPTAPGTDHTRELVPVLSYSPAFSKTPAGERKLGTRQGFMDIAATVAFWLGLEWKGPGVAFIPELSKVG